MLISVRYMSISNGRQPLVVFSYTGFPSSHYIFPKTSSWTSLIRKKAARRNVSGAILVDFKTMIIMIGEPIAPAAFSAAQLFDCSRRDGVAYDFSV